VAGEDVLTHGRAIALGIALASCLVARPSPAQDDDRNADLRRPDRLTVGVTDDLLGQLSPDGQTLYYVSNRDTTNQIFAQSISDGRAHQLFDDDADVTWPKVSSDGKWLLYISFGERASGQLCVRRLPAGDARRCLEDPSAALQAEWIGESRIALVTRQSIAGDLRILDVTMGPTLSARPLLDRNLTSPAVSPDGRWLVYVPVERTVESVGPAFAAKAAPQLEATLLGSSRPPARIALDLPGQTGQPVFARDGRSLYVVQFFIDSNHDGVVDASDHGVLFRVPISFAGDSPVAGPPEQLTETSWNCEYPAPSTDRLIATCSQDASLDVYSLPLDGEVPADWSAEQLETAIESADSRVEQQLLSNRRLGRETTTSGRRLATLSLAMLHLALEQYRPAEFYAAQVAALHDHATGGISHPLLALVEQRRAVRQRERGRTLEGFGAGARQRLEKLVPGPTASPMAVALTHVVRSEIADSIGDKTQARTELEAVALDETAPPPILEVYYERADTLYRELDDRDALVAVGTKLSANKALSGDEQLRYARAAVRAMVRGLSLDDASARVIAQRAAAADDSELAFALDLARAVLAIRDKQADKAVTLELLALYAKQTRPARRHALMTDAVERANEVGADHVVEALAQRNIEAVKRGTRERRSAERLYRRVMTGRAFRRVAERRFAEARADFDAVAEETGSYEAVVTAIDMRLKTNEGPAEIEAWYERKGTAPALSHFAKAYLLARQLPRLDGEAHAKAATLALGTLHASWSELKNQRIAQALDGALLHEEYLRTGDLAAAEKANVHYLIALELVGQNARFRAMILGELGLLHTQVGNYRIALGYLLDRDKLPYADNSEGLAVHLAKARALLHVGRDKEAAAAGEEAIAMIDRAPALAPYRPLAVDRAAVDNLAAGHFARALALYDSEVPLLDAARSPAAERNRIVARLARAAASVGAGQAARALEDLTYVEGRLGDPAVVATLVWPNATPDDVVRTYRLITTGLRARAEEKLGRLDAESKAMMQQDAVLVARLARANLVDIERAAMLTEMQLALNASDRHDAAATGSWLTLALGRADDLHARANGVSDKDQLDVTWLAAELTTALGTPLVAALPKRIDTALAELVARRDPALRSYERWFEIYAPLVASTAPAHTAAQSSAPR
jgi:cellulose synthase operon protein C